MQKQRESYTLEFKHKAVELSNTYYNTTRAALELGTSAENIRRWKNQFFSKIDLAPVNLMYL